MKVLMLEIEAIRREAKRKENAIMVKYARDHNPVVRGDIVKDNVDIIMVDDIKHHAYGDKPCAVYYGEKLTKNGVPFKNGDRAVIFQNGMLEHAPAIKSLE